MAAQVEREMAGVGRRFEGGEELEVRLPSPQGGVEGDSFTDPLWIGQIVPQVAIEGEDALAAGEPQEDEAARIAAGID